MELFFFDALNDLRNLHCSIAATKNMVDIVIALSYTTSPVHTIEYALTLQKQEKLGADSICIKDMAGVMLPEVAYELFTKLKAQIKVL